MKILYIAPKLDCMTGYGRYALEIIDGSKAKGHSVTVFSEEGSRGAEEIVYRGPRILLSFIKAVVFRKKFDIVHALDLYPFGVIAWFYSLIRRTPYIITGVGTYAVAPLHNPRTAFFSKAAYQRATKVFAISEHTRDRIRNLVPNIEIQIINPGFSYDLFFRKHITTTKDRFILSVGNPKSIRGYHISIKAFAQIADRYPNLTYKIVGGLQNQIYYKELQRIVQDCNLQNRVKFLSLVSDAELRDLYAKAHVFLYTPVDEGLRFNGFGIVFLEAAAAGTPVIGSLDNGNAEAISVGKNGFLVPQNDISATSDALEKILSSEKLWKQMSEAGYAFAKKKSEVLPATQYECCYKKILTE